MRQGQSSLTAQGAALIRALEAKKPAEQRVCYDPLAHSFVHPILRTLGPLLMHFGPFRSPGLWEYFTARVRYVDDYITSSVQQGTQQLVILGAGYDSRAYYLEALRSLKQVFEVDHPATQRAKRARLKQTGLAPLTNIAYVPVNFMTSQLDSLFEHGYQADLPTLFVWEGVIPYLSAEAVDSTLAFIRQHALPGSAIIFDYLYAEALASAHTRSELSTVSRLRRISGEQIVFGIPAGTLVSFLTQRGFTDVVDITHTDLEQLYFQGTKREVASIYGIAVARVGQA